MKVVNEGPEKSPESERATLGPLLPFAFPVLVLVVLVGRVVVASSGAARFLPAPHKSYQHQCELTGSKSVHQAFWRVNCARAVIKMGVGG